MIDSSIVIASALSTVRTHDSGSMLGELHVAIAVIYLVEAIDKIYAIIHILYPHKGYTCQLYMMRQL